MPGLQLGSPYPAVKAALGDASLQQFRSRFIPDAMRLVHPDCTALLCSVQCIFERNGCDVLRRDNPRLQQKLEITKAAAYSAKAAHEGADGTYPRKQHQEPEYHSSTAPPTCPLLRVYLTMRFS